MHEANISQHSGARIIRKTRRDGIHTQRLGGIGSDLAQLAIMYGPPPDCKGD